ncbi:hypothetical protein ACFQ0M_49735 [Kitasatospora aburaviensis]
MPNSSCGPWRADSRSRRRASPSDGGAAAFLYRHEFLPDGRVRTVMVRLDAVGMPFPPPDRPDQQRADHPVEESPS